MTTKNLTTLALAAFVVVVSCLAGHFYPPSSILATPVVVLITTLLVCLRLDNVPVLGLAVLTYVFVALNDFGVKLYGGGAHDLEGQGVISLFLFVGSAIAAAVLVVEVLRHKDASLTSKLLALLLFAGLVAAHLALFGWLGVDRSQYQIDG